MAIWQEGGERITLGEQVNRRTPARPTSSGSERRRSFSERRPSFLHRRTSGSTTGTSPSEPDSLLARQVSNLPVEPSISEEPAETPQTPVREPLSLDATDVHLFGQLTIDLPNQTPTMYRTLIQSYQTPEVGISYVIEVGLQPKQGAIKEAFSHIWGGGLIEVVLGHRTDHHAL